MMVIPQDGSCGCVWSDRLSVDVYTPYVSVMCARHQEEYEILSALNKDDHMCKRGLWELYV
jgi:hypothetical protein